MTETIQQLKEDIAILQEKLQKLEELQRTKTPVEECYKDWWGQYPELETDSQYDDIRWQGFQAGYEFAYAISTAKEVMEKVQEEQEEDEWKSVALRFGEKLSGYLSDGYYELSPAAWFRWAVFTYGKGQQIKDAVRESVKWCEEHPEKSVEDYLTPHTTEETEQSLKEAFKEAQQTEKWKETQKKIDTPKESWMNKPIDELVDMLEKDPPKCLEFQLGKTLEQIVTRWWCDIFSTNSDWDMETSIQDLCDRIHLWLPKEQDSSGTQRIETIVAVDTHNELLRKIKSKLHNKKA